MLPRVLVLISIWKESYSPNAAAPFHAHFGGFSRAFARDASRCIMHQAQGPHYGASIAESNVLTTDSCDELSR